MPIFDVTLETYGNCTVWTEDDRHYNLVNYGYGAQSAQVNPPAIFVFARCCPPDLGKGLDFDCRVW